MQFADILVCIDGSLTGRKRADYALALAARSGARLTGYYLPSEGNAVGLHDTERAEINEAAAVEFDREIAANSIEGTWVVGDRSRGVEDVINYARCSDLVVIGLGPPDDPGSDPQRLDVERIVIECGRPVLGMPIIGLPETIGKRILLAWDGRRACTRALHDALPFLKEAETVRIVSVDADPFFVASATNAAAHLERLGVTAEVDTALDLQLPIGEEILSRIEREEIDLLVAGAFGHSRIWEHLFGGTSRTLLHQMMVPVLVSH